MLWRLGENSEFARACPSPSPRTWQHANDAEEEEKEKTARMVLCIGY